METDILSTAREGIFILLKISLPILAVALLVGLIISLLQALTQIQEATLSFVPKIVAILLSILIFGPFISSNLKYFVERIFQQISGM